MNRPIRPQSRQGAPVRREGHGDPVPLPGGPTDAMSNAACRQVLEKHFLEVVGREGAAVLPETELK